MHQTGAQFRVDRTADATELAFAGRLDAAGAAEIWRPAVRAASGARGRALVIELASVSACDMAGAALVVAAEAAHGAPAELRGADPSVLALITRARTAVAVRPAASSAGEPSAIGAGLVGFAAAANGIAFLGEAAVATLTLPRRRRMLRPADLLRYADQAGVKSLPLVMLLGFLMGLILAFQSSVPLQRFGAELYVANLVSVSLTRELGPLLAAVILAGRTASAFAAEIGTMKVNEEIDALVTMGLDPMTMLVLPRMAAALAVMPVMTLVLELSGLVGMAVVMRGFGFSLGLIETQVQYWTTRGDLYGGLFKAAVFGAVVAAIGCRSGLGTGLGPRAVGHSATAAVVGGIVATIVLDGIFAMIFNRIGV